MILMKQLFYKGLQRVQLDLSTDHDVRDLWVHFVDGALVRRLQAHQVRELH